MLDRTLEHSVRRETGVKKGSAAFCRFMKIPISSSTVIMALWCTAVVPTNGQVNVTQQHNHLSRDGLYVDPAFSPANAANFVGLFFRSRKFSNVFRKQ